MKTKNFTQFLCITALFGFAACETPDNISKIHRDYYHHNNGNNLPMVRKMDHKKPHAHPHAEYAPAPVHANTNYNTNEVSNFFGTVGNFTLSDRKTGQIISQGRAFNAPEGLYLIVNGQKTNTIITSQAGTSLIYLPDIK